MIWMTVNDVVMFFAADWFGFQCLSLGCHIASAIPRNTGVRFWIKRGKGLFFQRFMWMQRFRRIHLIISRESTGKTDDKPWDFGGYLFKKKIRNNGHISTKVTNTCRLDHVECGYFIGPCSIRCRRQGELCQKNIARNQQDKINVALFVVFFWFFGPNHALFNFLLLNPQFTL